MLTTMKRASVILAGMLLAAPALAGGRVDELLAALNDPTGRPLVVAHRGCWKDNAESSLAALAACRRLGADIIELDVQRTADGRYVVMHDETVDRTTNGSGKVRGLTLEKLRGLRLRRGAGGSDAALTEETVPTLEELLAAARGQFLLSLNLMEGDKAGWAETDRLVEQLGMSGQLLSGSDDLRPKANGGPPRVRAMHITYRPTLSQDRQRRVADMWRERGLDRLRAGLLAVSFDDDSWLRENAPLITDRGSRIQVDTVDGRGRFAAGHSDERALRNPAAEWGRLLDLGASVIRTDEPEALLAYLKRREAASHETREDDAMPGTKRRAVARPLSMHKVLLIGDGAMAPGKGWGGELCAVHVAHNLACEDLAQPGLTTSALLQGGWDQVLGEASVSAYGSVSVLIEFGSSAEKEAEFADNLRRFVRELRARGATPVLVTPLVRSQLVDRQVRIVADPWAGQVRGVATEMGVPLVDLNQRSADLVSGIGADAPRRTPTQELIAGKLKAYEGRAGGRVLAALAAWDIAVAVPGLRNSISVEAP